MRDVYLFVLDTMADWEIGHLVAELNSRRFLNDKSTKMTFSFVGSTLNAITTMGGLTITPKSTIEEVPASKETVLILPGADTWSDQNNACAVEKAAEVIKAGGLVAAICGATVALASAGLLDEAAHTSNGAGFLDMFAKEYRGNKHYVDEPAVKTEHIITGAATGSLLWTKYLLEALNVINKEALDSWYHYFATGRPEYFYSLIQYANNQ